MPLKRTSLVLGLAICAFGLLPSEPAHADGSICLGEVCYGGPWGFTANCDWFWAHGGRANREFAVQAAANEMCGNNNAHYVIRVLAVADVVTS
jgi:hypothetical protein